MCCRSQVFNCSWSREPREVSREQGGEGQSSLRCFLGGNPQNTFVVAIVDAVCDRVKLLHGTDLQQDPVKVLTCDMLHVTWLAGSRPRFTVPTAVRVSL